MSPLIASHLVAACLGLSLGAWQLFLGRRGTPGHRLIGRVWVIALLYVSVSSFWIREIRDGSFSLLHILSVVTIITVSLGVLAARRGDMTAHRGNMTGSWIGLSIAGIVAAAIPQRALPQLVVHDPVTAALGALAIVALTAVVVLLGRALDGVRRQGAAPAADLTRR